MEKSRFQKFRARLSPGLMANTKLTYNHFDSFLSPTSIREMDEAVFADVEENAVFGAGRVTINSQKNSPRKLNSEVTRIIVHSCTLPKGKEDWEFNVEMVIDDKHWSCKRSYLEFWQLHTQLMADNPLKAGNGSSRVIPFLDPPAKESMPLKVANHRVMILNHYCQNITELGLIGLFKSEFFLPRGSDQRDFMSGASVDLLCDLNNLTVDEKSVAFKIFDNNSQLLNFEHCFPITYQSIMLKAKRVFPGGKRLVYNNEFGDAVTLAGDKEINLLAFGRARVKLLMEYD